MQSSDVEQIRKSWGDKPCDHPSMEKEYYLGAHTGDYVCTQCGEDFTREEYLRIKENRRSKS